MKKQRVWRTSAPAWKECHLQLSFPNWPNTYEDSIWTDLFNNDLVLEALVAGETPTVRRLGFVDRHGLHSAPGKPEDRLFAHHCSPWINLNETLAALPSDFHPTHLQIASRRNEAPFYLFFRIHLSPEPAPTADSRLLEFCVDLDEDWSALVFPVPGFRHPSA